MSPTGRDIKRMRDDSVGRQNPMTVRINNFRLRPADAASIKLLHATKVNRGRIRLLCLAKLRYAARCSSTSTITILNGTTRVKAIFSSSLRQDVSPKGEPLALATGSAACSSSTSESLDSLTTRGADS